jgi:hypothetical protein
MAKQRRLIVFLIPPEKLVNGGILSIFSICRESRAFESVHKAKVVLATYPGTKSYRKNDLFENDETIYSFDELVAEGSPDFLLLHIPEYASHNTFESLRKYSDFIGGIADFRVNIMNQNILLMQRPIEVAHWFTLTPHVTQTTAHNKYTVQSLADTYNTPVKHLSTFVDASQYNWVQLKDKRNLIVLSPDIAVERENIVQLLEKNLPDYEIRTIQNLSYEDYKQLMGEAKFAITFGEGFDGYYVEAFFTGGMAFAIYNEEFFPDPDFGNYANTYPDYTAMKRDLIADIKRFAANQSEYERVGNANLKKINELYNFDRYKQNIKEFYEDKFTFLPTHASADELIGSILRETDATIAEKDKHTARQTKAIHDMEQMIADKSQAIQELDQKIHDLEHSLSWRVTKPLRKASGGVKKQR